MEPRQNKFVESSIESLTRGEREILVLLGESLTSRDVAERLNLAASTTRWHIRPI